MAFNDFNAGPAFHPCAPAAWPDETRLLGALCFDDVPLAAGLAGVPIAMDVLAGDETCETWLGRGTITAGSHGNLHYRHDEEWLFGAITLDESSCAAAGSGTPLQCVAESAYRQIFAVQDALDYPCTHRFWNYMAGINDFSHDLERYRQFNIGRQQAFLACERQVAGQLPAACALGYTQGPLTVAFLAGRTPSIALENPRQLSAYRYPAQYGPRSPTFARASLLQRSGAHLLLISGTASIVGHATLHQGDAAAQARESWANVAAVVEAANHRLQRAAFDMAHGHYRVYVRHAAQLPQIRQALQGVGMPANALYVAADICRADLLIEIEATITERDSTAAESSR